VPAHRDSSPQTRAVLAALGEDQAQWRYGYAIARQTGLASGTLYPILGRLADRGLLETCWEADPPEGRPRRHLYRLTGTGLALAAEQQQSPPVTANTSPATGTSRARRRRPAVEGA